MNDSNIGIFHCIDIIVGHFDALVIGASKDGHLRISLSFDFEKVNPIRMQDNRSDLFGYLPIYN